jgi:ankyrin repeat protein
MNNHCDLISLLLDFGAQIEAVDLFWERSPLQVAANKDLCDCVSVLLNRGANVEGSHVCMHGLKNVLCVFVSNATKSRITHGNMYCALFVT